MYDYLYHSKWKDKNNNVYLVNNVIVNRSDNDAMYVYYTCINGIGLNISYVMKVIDFHITFDKVTS